MPDGLPTENDMHAAAQMFGTGEGQYDQQKMANEIARHKRLCNEQGTAMDDVITCLKGDSFGRNIGMIEEQKKQGELLTDVHTMMTKNATTKTYNKSDALEKDTTKTVHMLMGGLVVIGFVVNAVIALL